jgi:MFS family permease
VPLLLILRRDLRESHAFEKVVDRRTRDIVRILWRHRRRVVAGLSLVLMTTVIFYLITAYTPTYGKLLGLSERDGLLVTAAVGLSNMLWLPPVGALADRIGRRPILIVCTSLTVLTAYPAMAWLADAPSLMRLIAVDLWFSAIFASYNAALVVHLTEIVPAEARVCGFSLAWSLATAVGGFSPFIVTWGIGVTGNHAIPGAWLTLVALISFVAALTTPSALDPVAKPLSS